jgi:hypothetical protein
VRVAGMWRALTPAAAICARAGGAAPAGEGAPPEAFKLCPLVGATRPKAPEAEPIARNTAAAAKCPVNQPYLVSDLPEA